MTMVLCVKTVIVKPRTTFWAWLFTGTSTPDGLAALGCSYHAMFGWKTTGPTSWKMGCILLTPRGVFSLLSCSAISSITICVTKAAFIVQGLTAWFFQHQTSLIWILDPPPRGWVGEIRAVLGNIVLTVSSGAPGDSPFSHLDSWGFPSTCHSEKCKRAVCRF